jgi:thiol-disulfide isomerase/thioredoxin
MREEADMSTAWKQSMTVVGLSVVAALLLAACGSVLSGDSKSAGAVAPIAADDPLASDFQIDLYHGGGLMDEGETSLSDVLRLGRPVVLNMWAGLCPPCRLEMPDFQEVSDEFGDEIAIVGLDVGPFTNLGTSQEGRALIQELGIIYLTGTTTDPAVVKAYQLLGMPTTYFIKPDGQILRRWTGLLTADKLGELVQELTQASVRS